MNVIRTEEPVSDPIPLRQSHKWPLDGTDRNDREG